MDSRIYTIEDIPGKGKGLIATAKIAKGTRVLSEEPLFTFDRDVSCIQEAEQMTVKQLLCLNKDQQRAFLSLNNAHGNRKHSVFLGIARTNALPLGSGTTQGGIFIQASRINHACRPNAQNAWNSALNKITIHATVDIEKGEEIAINYLSGTQNYALRQERLRDSFGFVCACDLCSQPFSQRQLSDQRRDEISWLDDQLGDIFSIFMTPLSVLHSAFALLTLLKEEGITDTSVSRLYYDALQIVIANGDQARAKVFAKRAHDASVLFEGEDSTEVSRLRGFMNDPSTHSLYGKAMTWKQGVDRIPQGLSEDNFEDWLWRK